MPDAIHDLPPAAELLALGRELLLGELLPLLPPERERELRLVATAMGIAEREAAAGDAPATEIAAQLAEFYGCPEIALSARPWPKGGREGVLPAQLRRLAADLRTGAFEACEAREADARAILWRLTMMKLREGNPAFLAANGFGD